MLYCRLTATTKKMIKIFNGTAHNINFYKESDIEGVDGRTATIQTSATPYYVIPSGSMLDCKKGASDGPVLDVGFPVRGAIEFLEADPLPNGYDLYIVSNLYRSACVALGRSTDKLATVDGVVYAAYGDTIRPCGCLRLAIG